MLGTDATANSPLIAAWHGALLAAAMRFAVAAASVGLDAAFSLTAAASAMTNAVAPAIGFPRASRERARLGAAVSLTQSTMLAETFAPSDRAPWFPSMRTASSEADLLLCAVRKRTRESSAMRQTVSAALVVLIAIAT